jgi:hypothetical protein
MTVTVGGQKATIEDVPVVLLVTGDTLVVSPEKVTIKAPSQQVVWYAAGPDGVYQVDFAGPHGTPFNAHGYNAEKKGKPSGKAHRIGTFKYSVTVEIPGRPPLFVDPEVDVDPGTGTAKLEEGN